MSGGSLSGGLCLGDLPNRDREILDPPLKNITYSEMHSMQWRIQDFSQGGAPTSKSALIFQFCSRKLHENERIWTPRGGGARPWRPPLDPPMVCVNTLAFFMLCPDRVKANVIFIYVCHLFFDLFCFRLV